MGTWRHADVRTVSSQLPAVPVVEPSAVTLALRSAREDVDAAFAGTRDADAALAAAAATLRAAIAVHGELPQLMTGLGAVACDSGEHAAARALLEQALAKGSQDRHTVFNLGVALINSGCSAQAGAAFARASTMTASPDTWQAWFDPQAH